MNRNRHWRRRVAPLPLQALYTLEELATAASMRRERLLRLFERLGIVMMRPGKPILVPLSELEKKAWPFWESIESAETARRGADP